MSKIPKKRIFGQMDNENILFDVKEIGTSKRNGKFKRTEKSISFSIKHNFDKVNLLLIKENIVNGFDNLIKKCIENENENNYIAIEIEHISLEVPIYIGYTKIKNFDVSAIFNRIEKFSQSNKQLFANGEIVLHVIIVENTKGLGKKSRISYVKKSPKTFNEISYKKRSVISIINDDKLCGFRALVIGKYYTDNKNNLNKKEWNYLIDGRKNMQKIEALKLKKELGIDCEEIYAEDWSRIQNKLPDYQIKIIDGKYKGNFIFRGEIKPKKIYLEFIDDHYNAITNIKAYMTHKQYCEDCHVVFSNLFDHKCPSHCKQCYTNCFKSTNIIKCDSCNRDFFGDNCYQSHILNKLCEHLKTCENCGITHKRKYIHNCTEYYCKKCYLFYKEQPHYCYIKSCSELNMHDQDAVNKFISCYDIESTQYSGEHRPNLLIEITSCDKCPETGQCDYCYIEKPEYYFGYDCVKRYVNYLFGDLAKRAEEKKAMIYSFAHNMSGYDGQFILREIWNKGLINVEVIMRGRKILMIRCGNVKMLDSLNFFLQPLANLPKALGLDINIKKGEFPHLFNRPENYDYKGIIPDIEYFGLEYASPNKKSKTLEWHNEYKSSGKIWNFKEELINYCKNDVEILSKCVLKFRQVFKGITHIDPFTRAFTLASIGLEVFKANYLNETKLANTPVKGYSVKKNYSLTATCWLDYIQKTLQIKLIREYRIGNYWVDGFDAENRVVYEFNGCLWHGHDCSDEFKDELKLKKLEEKLTFLRKDYTVETIWECDYRKLRSNNECLRKYHNSRFQYYLKLKNIGPTIIKCNGGRTNNVVLTYEAEPGVRINYVDFISLYPSVLKKCVYPIGHPLVINEDFDYTLESYFGFASCKVEAPRGLYFAVLPVVIDDKLMFPLCVNCAENRSAKCECNDRSFVGCWSIQELKWAIKRGYKILEIYEVLHYPETSRDGNLFGKFIDMFLKIKQESSGWPSWCKEEEDKQKYILNYKEHEGIELDYNKIEKNEALRFIAKIMLNSLWGKFAQRPNQSRTVTVTHYDEYFEIISDQRKEVTGELMVNEDVLILNWQYKDDSDDPARNYNIALASHVTSNARLKLLEVMENLENKWEGSVLYHDTDSVIYKQLETDAKIKSGDYLGELTDEITKNYGEHAKCIKFVSLGPKNYAYLVDMENEEYKTEIKCKGISLNCSSRELITFDKMFEMAKRFCDSNEIENLKVPQKQFVINQHNQIFTREFEKIYKVVSEKRAIIGNKTVPFGYY